VTIDSRFNKLVVTEIEIVVEATRAVRSSRICNNKVNDELIERIFQGYNDNLAAWNPLGK
jgi:hypothetical protein